MIHCFTTTNAYYVVYNLATRLRILFHKRPQTKGYTSQIYQQLWQIHEEKPLGTLNN